MGWICPDCGKELEIWERECRECAGATSPGAETPAWRYGALLAAQPAGRRSAQPRGAASGLALIPWFAYVVMGLVAAALAILLWP